MEVHVLNSAVYLMFSRALRLAKHVCIHDAHRRLCHCDKLGSFHQKAEPGYSKLISRPSFNNQNEFSQLTLTSDVRVHVGCCDKNSIDWAAHGQQRRMSHGS